jgi:hypothetical protein
MSDKLVDRIRSESYMLEIFGLTCDVWYVDKAKNIIDFVRELYRRIEPSHFSGEIFVFLAKTDIDIISIPGDSYYDNSILNHNYNNIVFQLNNQYGEMPKIWVDVQDCSVLKSTSRDFIAYYFDGASAKECFYVNGTEIAIRNQFSCPSIFALQYHYLNEALTDYTNERIRAVSCEHFKKCFFDINYIYFKNKPEACMQKSLSEYLKSRLRGVNVDREYNLNASKPVDVRVLWREANRSALIEMKWLGQSLKNESSLGTYYSNGRANKGMNQIKEYLDLAIRDNPTLISKGYLVVIDGRREGVGGKVVTQIDLNRGMKFAGASLTVKSDLEYWKTFPNISPIYRMFAQPICIL